MTTISRRAALALPGLLAAPHLARAQSRTITMICPFGPGTNVDAIARVMAPELSSRLDRQVVVENVTGAGGTIGTERAARAAPDGSTLLLAVESTINVAQLVTPSTVRYDGLRDFAPIHMVATLPLLLIGKPALAAASAAPAPAPACTCSASCWCSARASAWSTCPTAWARRC